MFSLFSVIASLSTSKPLYLGPETVMPLASILAAIIGVLLMFWRVLFGFAKRVYKYILRKLGHVPEPTTVTIDESEKSSESLD